MIHTTSGTSARVPSFPNPPDSFFYQITNNQISFGIYLRCRYLIWVWIQPPKLFLQTGFFCKIIIIVQFNDRPLAWETECPAREYLVNKFSSTLTITIWNSRAHCSVSRSRSFLKSRLLARVQWWEYWIHSLCSVGRWRSFLKGRLLARVQWWEYWTLAHSRWSTESKSDYANL